MINASYNNKEYMQIGCQQTKQIGFALTFCLYASVASAVDKTEGTLFDMPLESLLQLKVSVASPFQERVANTAASVYVLTPDDWQRRSTHRLEHALEQVPALVSYPSLGTAYMTAIRGYSTELSVRGIANLLDGVPLNNFSYAASVYDLPYVPLELLQRVEVIRGPGSTLYGSDAFHGVLSLSTQGVLSDEQRVQISASSNQRYNVSAKNSLASERLSLQMGAAYTDWQGHAVDYQYTDINSQHVKTSERQHILSDKTGYLHLILGDKTEELGAWGVSVYSNDYQAQDFAGGGTQFYPPVTRILQLTNLNLAGSEDVSSQESRFSLWKLTHERLLTADIELSLKAYEWQSQQTWVFDFSQYPQESTLLNGQMVPCRQQAMAGASPLFCPHYLEQGTADTRQGLELLIKSDKGYSGQWAIGLGRDDEQVEKATVRRIGVNQQLYVDAHAPFEGKGRTIDHLFFHVRHPLWRDDLQMIYGLRWDDYSDIGSATSPRLGFVWQFSDAWTHKLLYSHAFRAPSAAERFGSGAGSQQFPNPNIKPETIDTFEWISQYQAEQQQLELTAFYNHWQDSIVLTPITQVLNQYINTGENKAYGLELVHKWDARPWQIQSSAAYVMSKNDTTGQRYTTFPRYSASLAVGYQWPQYWSTWLHQRILLHQTTTDVLATQTLKEADDYYRTDLTIQYQRDKQRYFLDVRNLWHQGLTVPSLYNAENGIPEEGRVWRIGLDWQW
ncbi:TonB-dependent receptor plug domain-containing protein [Agitococcus lubricus]|uniref:Outer membrane receptor protein involved in Fe transport n=1 Tax=Agitococcus lubricus TaxID=1077255 RepID=A0A2T5J2P9_9GAMM|nr:TonB-dependent receptor [Agitococcus lubricus]PTQ90798.1 outer membrane receptor protein involved in Fe transport [Agitococcus lubricus]